MNDSTWTWMSGSNVSNPRAIYGEKGKASPDYMPGGRGCAIGWFNSLKEEFWLFGGWGYDHVNGVYNYHLYMILQVC